MNDRLFRQAIIADWGRRTFGERTYNDMRERVARLLEEAVELAQCEGLPAEDAHRIVDYIYGRPVGNHYQEVGGVAVTLAAYAAVAGMNLDQAEMEEIRRVLNVPIEKFRAKQAAKAAVGVGNEPTAC